MAHVEIPAYKRVTEKQKKEVKREMYVPKIGLDEIIVGIISFLMSRVAVIDGLSPFGTAFFAAGYRGRKSVFSFAGACLGTLTMFQDANALKYIVSMILFSCFRLFFKRENSYKDAALAALSLFVCGFVKSLASYMLTYDLLILSLECFVCMFFVLAFKSAANYINNQKYFTYISNEQLLSLTFVLALSLSGIGRTVSIGYLNLCEIACSVIVMILAMERGGAFGACAGVVAGLVCAIGKENIMNVIGIYALCGFFAGCVRNLGKGGVCAGFLLSGACAGFLTSSALIESANIINMICGGVVFLAMPAKAFEKIKMFTDGICIEPDDAAYVKKAKDYILSRINSLAKSYEKLSGAVAVKSDDVGQSDEGISKALNNAVLKVCTRCGMKNMCWEKNNYLPKIIETVNSRAAEKGTADEGDFPVEFVKNCINFKEFSSCVNHFYSMSRVNELWQKQVLSSRQLISNQYLEFSQMLNKLRVEFADELSGEQIFEKKLETKIYNELLKLDLSPIDVNVRDADRGYYSVSAKFADSSYVSYKNEIMQLVSDILDLDMNVVNPSAGRSENVLFLEPVYRYLPLCASATVKKNKNDENGDSILKENMSKSRFFMAISDGMGSGKEAAVQSRKTNETLFELLSAQYSAAQAVKLANSALAAGSGEIFTTVDMAVIDLMDGKAEFVKIGAMPSVILHSDNIEAVFSQNLPIGILDNVNASAINKQLHADDVVIMFSDGVSDVKSGYDWIGEVAWELRKKKPDEICEIILKEAIIRNHGKVTDDMSVIVFQLKENL